MGDINDARRAFMKELDEEAERIRSAHQTVDPRELLKKWIIEDQRADWDEDPIRSQVLDEAKQAVCSDRNAEYGEPIDNFGRWAGACNALGYKGPGGRDLKPHDLAIIMGLGKLSRSIQSPDKKDTWVDLAGYAAVGYELVTLEGQ